MRKFYLSVIFIALHVMAFAQLQSIEVFAEGEKTSICEGDSVVLQVKKVIVGQVSYSYSWSPDYRISSTNTDSVIVKPEHTLYYYVTVTDLNHNIEKNDSIKIYVVPRPVVTITSNGTHCAGSAVEISADIHNESSVKWQHDGKGTLLHHDDSSDVSYVPEDGELGDVTVVVTAGGIDYCDPVSDTAVITYVQAASAEILTTAQLVCSNSSLTLSGKVENADSYEWSHNGDGELKNKNTLSPEYVLGEDEHGNVDVVLTAYGEYCTKYDTLSFFAGLSPEIQLPANDSVVENNSVFINPVMYNNIASAEWEHTGNGYFVYAEDSSSVTYMPAENELGNVRVTVVGQSEDCGSATDYMTIFYAEAPSAKITNSDSDTLLCGNEQLQLNGDVDNGQGYEWSHNGEGELTNASTLTPTYVPDPEESGLVQIVLHAWGVVGDSYDTFNVRVSSINFETDENVSACEGDDVLLSVLGPQSYSYEWSTGDTENQITVEATETTTYSVQVTNKDGCTAQADIDLEVSEKPVLSLSADTEDKILYVSPSGLEKYEFYDENDNLLYSGSNNYYDYSSVYGSVESITVVAYNEDGCASDKETEDGSNIYKVPALVKVDAFSPNGDGINDRLLAGRRIKVIDRSSKILYEGWDGWDGTYNGKKMPDGSYFYLLYNGNDVYYKGVVTIVREARN